MFGLSAGMVELMTEMAGFMGAALFLGIVLGYLVWGWRRRAKLEAARAEGAASVRTSVDGDASLRAQLDESIRDRGELKRALEMAHTKIAALEASLSARPRPVQTRPPLEPVPHSDPDDVLTPFEPPRRTEEMAEPADMRFDAPEEATEEAISQANIYEEEHEDLSLRAAFDERVEDVRAGFGEPAETAAEHIAETAEEEVLELTNPMPRQPRLILPAAPNEIDDLTRIDGVGAVMEGMLNDIGIYLYHQLANFTDEDLRWVAAMLEVNVEEIHDAQWIDQAREFYQQKYGLRHDA